nr:antitermination protein [Providencia rettgeri]
MIFKLSCRVFLYLKIVLVVLVRGGNRVPSSVVFKAIRHLVPDLTQSSWSRNWKPFYEKLASKCFIEESTAEQAFSRVIK